MRKTFLLSILTVLLMLFITLINSVAQIPRIMNYQASLIDADAKPINGDVEVTFSIFDDETASIPLWSETQTASCTNGFMNTYLGQNIPINLPFDKQYWIEVKIANNSYPRTKLTSSPYAIHAQLATKADTSDVAFTVVDGAITQAKLDPGVKALPWGPAGGVLSGQYPNPTLNQDTLLNIVDDNFIRRDEALLGDLAGIAGLPTVARIRGIVVSPTAPTLWQTFVYDGTRWKPSLLEPHSLSSNVPSDGNYLSYNSGTFSWGPAVIAGLTISGPPLNNTYIGYESGFSNTSGYFNTALGVMSLYGITTGSANVAIGYQALADNATGIDNTAVGFVSLQDNTTGNANTAMGFGSLSSNTTADNNTAYGYSSLLINLTGANNTAIGSDAMHDNTTGSSNVANGYQALYANTFGNANTANGAYALYSNTIGSGNTASGNGALYSNTDGDGNTAFGNQAGTLNITGTGNLFLGFQAGYNETGDNKLYIANTSVDPPLVGGDFATGRVGINTNAPAGALDVVSTTGALIVPRMTTVERDAMTAVNGMIIYNTTTNTFDFYENGAWVNK